jgi:hypothetical protein
MVNQLAFPGLGTIMAGRCVGWAQAVIMVAGFVCVTGFIFWYLSVLLRYAQHAAWTEDEFHAQYRPYLSWLYAGLVLCAVAWFWSLASSVSLWRADQRAIR